MTPDMWEQLNYKGQQHSVAYVTVLLAPTSEQLMLMLSATMFTLPRQSQMFWNETGSLSLLSRHVYVGMCIT